MASKDANQKAAFEFLQKRAESGVRFTLAELVDAVPGWKLVTAQTHYSKYLHDYLDTDGGGRLGVKAAFKRLTFEDYRQLAKQTRETLTSYNRATYHRVVVYDFFLPLTREDKLRRALDELFFRDTLERRLQEIGRRMLEGIVPAAPAESDAAYFGRLIDAINMRIGGFSISHVQGRFRTRDILARAELGGVLAKDDNYLIDESTAIVRFIIPCVASRQEHADEFPLGEVSPSEHVGLEAEIKLIRGLFFQVFVEAIVPTISGESLIWMLEASPGGQRLYELAKRSTPRPRGTRSSMPRNVDAVGTAKTTPSSARKASKPGARSDAASRKPAPKQKGQPGPGTRTDARTWLRANGYAKVAKLIDELMAEWVANGKATRRNWWEVLAGDASGQPRIISGRSFPVLEVAQIRQGRAVTPNAVQAPKGVRAPAVRNPKN